LFCPIDEGAGLLYLNARRVWFALLAATAFTAVAGTGCAVAAPGDWTLSKSASPTTYSAAGQVINYTYVITNVRGDDGHITSFTDDKVSNISCSAPGTPVPPAGLTCTGSYTITAADVTAGSVTNHATLNGDSCDDGCLVTATAQATVTFSAPPSWTLSKTANPTTYAAPGQVISYSYVLTNTGAVSIGSIAISDTRVASVSCPSTTLAAAAAMTCTGVYTITAADVAATSVTNVATATGVPASGTLAPVTASATIRYVGGTPSWTLTKAANPTTYSLPGQVITYTYVLTNTGNVAISNVALTDTRVTPVNCPATSLAPGAKMTCTGVYTITVADVTAATVTNIATATGTPAAGTLAPVSAQATITLNALLHQQQTSSLISQFLNYRLQMLTMDEPDRVQFLRRVPGALWGDDSSGSGAGVTPFSFAGNSDEASSRMSFSTSLSRIERAHEAAAGSDEARNALAFAGTAPPGALPFKAPPKPLLQPESGFDMWVEAHFSQFKATAAGTDNSGSFGIVYAGADYMLTRSLMVGLLLQYDWTRDRSQQLLLPTSTIEGQGAMAGPYVSGRISPNLFFDARVAWGLSSNNINPFGTYQDRFATDRWLAHANLTGNWVFGNFRFTPSAGVTYASEHQASYVDALGIGIPSQTVALGRFAAGPEVAYRFLGLDGMMYEPQFSLKGVWDFQRPDVPTVSGIVVSTDPLHAKAELALLARAPSGFSLRGAIAYDGIGSASFRDVSGRLWLNFPLH
jgi:uncharacterized repeat protein (TIGR01451 family)